MTGFLFCRFLFDLIFFTDFLLFSVVKSKFSVGDDFLVGDRKGDIKYVMIYVKLLIV